jgi:hypothetical protein
MSEKKSRTGAVNVGIEYALNPINHLGSYVDSLAGFNGAATRDNMSRFAGYPVLISKKGEHIDDRCMADYQKKFNNSDMLREERVAKKVAEDKGYLFFPGGKVEGCEFSRSFSFKDFVEGASGITRNIDRKKNESYETYSNFVSTEIEKMKETLKYFDEATLKYCTNTFSSVGAHLVAELNPDFIDGFKKWSTSGFEGAWVDMDMTSGHDKKSFFDKNVFKAQFNPCYIDSSFSAQDLGDINSIAQNVANQNKARELEKGYTEEIHIEANKKDESLIDMNLYMHDAEDYGRILPVKDMVGTFTKYLHLIDNGIQAVANRKEGRKNTRIAALEDTVRKLSK